MLPEGHRRTNAAVIKLHTLPDTVRAAPQDHHRALSTGLRLILFVIRRIEIRSGGRKLAGAGIHRLVSRPDGPPMPLRPDGGLGGGPHVPPVPGGKAPPL